MMDEIRPIPDTNSGITKDGRVWNYDKGDWRIVSKRGCFTVRLAKGVYKKMYVRPTLVKIWGADLPKKTTIGVSIRCIETDEEFVSYAAATKAKEFAPTTLRAAVEFGSGLCGGFHWEKI